VRDAIPSFEVDTAPPRPRRPPPLNTRTYLPEPEGTWWLRNRRYVLYMFREFTSIPIAAWVMVFMVQVARLQGGRATYEPLGGPIWIAFSLLCLVCALWHSFTFLSLAGNIIRIPRGDRYVPPRVIVAGMFGLFVVVTIVIAGLLAMGGSAR
jgi:fumarate reductase subunit C